jgi:poly(3-hydroxybutyrate) depolymerase
MIAPAARSPTRWLLLALGMAVVLASALWRGPAWAAEPVAVSYGGRQMLVYVPSHLAPAGSRALVVVLHGGLGNALRIASGQSESGLNMNAVAEQNGFIVAYLNGTPVTLRLSPDMLGWNAGGCCGQPAANGVDDVTYIRGAVADLIARYGIDPARVFGMGHSNGAMMTQRLVCETNLYAAAVAISGPLELAVSTCPDAKGKRILAIHGADDANVPVAGGLGTKGISHAVFNSEDRSRQVFTNAGAVYTLQIVPGADHMLDHIQAVIVETEGVTIAQKAAAFFGILQPAP